MPLNLGTYHQQDDNRTDNSHHQCIDCPLSWRQSKDDSLSDWTIIIKDDDTATHYHVHKIQLGVGPRRSEYFSRLFRTKGLAETESRTSEVTLEHSAAEAFPIMLDYIYSPEGTLEATTALATALRYLANYFGICNLFSKVNKFIRNDLMMDKVSIYWKEALLYNDESLLDAMKQFMAENFGIMNKTEILLEMSPSHFCDVVSSPRLKCESEMLSERVAQYLKANEDQISGDLIRSLTCPDKMPCLAPETAAFFAKLVATHLQDSDKSDEPTLYDRCMDALMKSESQGFKETVQKQDYKKLPKDVRLKLSEALLSFKTRNQPEKCEINELRKEVDKLRNEHYKLKNENCKLKNENCKLMNENYKLKNYIQDLEDFINQ